MKTKQSSNIPSRKSVESKPSDSNPLLSCIIGSPPNIVFLYSNRNYRYAAVNTNHKQTKKNIWGADVEPGTNVPEIIEHPKYREKAKKCFNKGLKEESFTFIEELRGNRRNIPHSIIFSNEMSSFQKSRKFL